MMVIVVVVTVKMMMIAWIVVCRSTMGLIDCWLFEKPQKLPSMHLQGRIGSLLYHRLFCDYDECV